MDNEKLNNEELEATEETAEVVEETTEAVEEVTEEAVEEAAVEEVAEEVVEEAAEVTEEDAEVVEAEADAVEEVAEEDAETSEEAAVDIVQIWQCPKCETVCDDAVCSVCGEQCELIEIEATAGEITEGPRKNIAAIAGGIAAVVIALVAILWYAGVINPYEIGYVDVTGTTLADVADQSGYSISEYKKVNGLSWLMPKSTNENAVKNNVKVKTIIAQSGMTFEDFKEYYGWGDNVTENATVGKALGETKLSVILGVKDMEEEMANQTLSAFKEFYGFGDDVTLDTLYKDVRVAIDKKTRDNRIEQEKEAEKAEEEASEDDGADVETKDADAEPEEEEPAEEPEAEEEAAE